MDGGRESPDSLNSRFRVKPIWGAPGFQVSSLVPKMQGWVDIIVSTLGGENLMNLVSSSMCLCYFMVLLKSALVHIRV